MMGDENLITNSIDTNKKVSPKGVKFFCTYFGLYLAVWVIFFIIARICNPTYFQNSLDVSYMIMGFLLSIPLVAGLGIIPAIILEKSEKRGYVYLCVLGFLLINLLAFVLFGTAFKPLCWIPTLYDLPFILMMDATSLDTLLSGSSSLMNFLSLAIFPTVYYLLLVWVSLRVTRRRD